MHFLSKLHKNSILTGFLDSYCLVCHNYLRTEDEAFTHMDKPIHRKNMGLAVKVDKFLEDRIVKVKKGYYCPFCNILLSTTTRVNIHIADPTHIDNKRSQITRTGDTIVAFDEVAITLDSWHGITDNTCVVCNTEFDDDDGHSKDHLHVLKLIQNKCEFGDRYVYRKVDEDSFFCLICASVFAINEKREHHESTGHKHFYNTARDLKRKLPPVTQTEIKVTPKTVPSTLPNNNFTNVTDNKIDINKTEKQNKLAQHVDDIKTKTELKKTENLEVKKDENGNTKLFNKHNGKQSVLKDKPQPISNINNNQEKPATNGVTLNGVNAKKAVNIDPVEDNKRNSNILDRVEEFQKKGINIDFTSEKARCKKCYENLLFDTIAIEKHIEQHNPTKIANINVKTESKKIEIATDKPLKKLDTTHHVSKANVSKKTETEKQPKQLETTHGTGPNKEINQDDKQSVIVEKSNDKKTKKVNNNNKKTVIDNQAKQGEANGKAAKQVGKMNNQTKIVTNGQQTQKEDIAVDKQLKKDIGKPKKVETKPVTNNLAEFAKEHQMVLLPNETFCPLCRVSTASNKEAITEHSNLNTHKENAKNETLGLQVALEYVESVIRLESTFSTDIILNEKYVLRQNSFHCMVMDEDDEEHFTCLLCDVRVRVGQEMVEHMNTPEHGDKLGLTQVVTSLPEEFVREILPGTYHCGACNEMCRSWPSMGGHLASAAHACCRRHASLLLQRSQPAIKTVNTLRVSSLNAVHYA